MKLNEFHRLLSGVGIDLLCGRYIHPKKAKGFKGGLPQSQFDGLQSISLS